MFFSPVRDHRRPLGDNGGRMNPDPGSGRAVPYGAQFTLALIQMNTDCKTSSSPVPREKPVISPRNVSDRKWPFPKILKIKIPTAQNSCSEAALWKSLDP